MSSVEIVALNKSYRSGFKALTDISLVIEDGCFATLVGPSGCGKTTLLRSLAGFVTPTSGDIRVNSESIVNTPIHRRNTAMVFQNYALFPHLTVEQNIAFGLEMSKVPAGEIRDRVAEGLRLVQLPEHAARYPRQLSGGQQQRVALARALVTRPRVLLLDEPLSNLDAKLRLEMREEIREIQQRLSMTTIFVTHDQEEALSMSDIVVIMRDGRIEQSGTPAHVYSKPATKFVAQFMGDSNIIGGTVEEYTDGLVTLRHPSGVMLFGKGISQTKGSAAVMAVRAEVVSPVGGPSNEFNTVPATIRGAIYLGDHFNMRCDTPIGPLRWRAQLATAAAYPVGSNVTLGWDVADGAVLSN